MSGRMCSCIECIGNQPEPTTDLEIQLAEDTTRLRQQLEIMKAALKYYADGEHIRHLSNGDCVFEYGDIAQEALAQIRELEK